MPTLHLMVGLPGSGKTTAARRIAEETGAVRFTPDDWHLALFGDDFGDPAHDARHDRIEGLMWGLARDLLQRQVSVILDFGFWSHAERADFRARGDALGVKVVTHALILPFETLMERVTARMAADPGGNYRIARADMAHWVALFEVPDPDELWSSDKDKG